MSDTATLSPTPDTDTATPDPKDTQAVIHALSHWQPMQFPYAAVEAVHTHRELYEPLFLEVLDRHPSEFVDEHDEVLTSAFYTLARYCSTAAFPKMIAFLKRMTREEEDILGDSITESVSETLAACYDGDFAQFEALLTSEETYFFARTTPLHAMEILVFENRLDAETVIDLMERLSERYLHSQHRNAEDMLMFLSISLGNLSWDAAERLAGRVLEERNPPENSDLHRELDYYLTHAHDEASVRRNREFLLKRYRDVTELGLLDLENIPFFTEPPLTEAEEAAILARWERLKQPNIVPAPVRTGPKIGRNAPCPCGSGKKYKKCCLGRD